MTTHHTAPDNQWARLATVPELKRIDLMMDAFVDIAGLSEDERLQRLYTMVTAEGSLPDDTLFEMTKSRLRAWTRMDEQVAHTVADDFYPLLREMGPDVQRRYKSIEERVFESLPWEQKNLSLKFIPADEGYAPPLIDSIEPVDEAEVPGGNAARQEEIEERALDRWERFHAWVTAQRPAA
jgi:hypothetical protein